MARQPSSMRWADQMKRQIRLYVDARLSPDQMGEVVAAAAQTNLQALIDRGIASTNYETVVDGVQGADESTVKLDGGTIEYVFNDLREAAIFALQYCRDYSPIGPTGEYQRAWFVIADGIPWVESLEDLPDTVQQIIITNPAPYARRLERSKTIPADHVVAACVSATGQQYPGLRVVANYVDIPFGGAASGTSWTVPYVLKRPPGGVVQYPAVVISQG